MDDVSYPTTKLVHTQKLFFKKYPYSIQFDIISNQTALRRLNVSREIADWGKKNGYQVKQYYGTVSLYCSTRADISNIVAKFPNIPVRQISSPASPEAEHTLLHMPPNMVMRSKLFRDKYAVKIQLTIPHNMRREAIRNHIINICDANNMKWGEDYFVTFNSTVLYLAEPNHAVITLIKMGIGDVIRGIIFVTSTGDLV